MTRITLAGCLAILAGSTGVLAQQNQAGIFIPDPDDGTELFRGLFHFHEIEPETLDNVRRTGYEFSNLIVVIFGPPNNQTVTATVRGVLSNGGAVLFASDKELPLSGFLPRGGDVTIDGTHVQFQRDLKPLQGVLQGYIAPVPPPPNEIGRSEFELFPPFNRIEVNTASYIRSRSLPLEVARTTATFPKPTLIGRQAAGSSVFAAAGVGIDPANPFRCVAIADTDLFSNKLMYGSARAVEPNDNLKFANNLVQWLKGPEGRAKCLFVQDGQVVERFDEVKFSAIPIGPDVPPVPVPSIDPFDEKFQQGITDSLNEIVQRAQDNNLANDFLAGTNNRKAQVYAALATLAAIVAYVLLRTRTLGQRFTALFRPIPKDPHRLGPDTAVGSLEHRRLELLRGGDYGGPVRSYVRQLFEGRGLPRGYDADRLPAVEFDVRNPEFLRHSVRTLWADVRSHKPIDYSRWKELEPMLAAVRAAAEDDRWWFTPDEGTA